MNKSKLGFFLLCAAIFAGIAISTLGCAGMGLMYGTVSVNIIDQPLWGPTGYDRADYYYFPDIDCYYSVAERQYIYWDGSYWRYGASLPPGYATYDPYRSYKVVINEDKPYRYNESHRAEYKAYKGKKDQPVIRDSRDPKYSGKKERPDRDNGEKQQNH
ncbi:MAG: hypothetical protein NTU47_14095 [Ignavibacteriales bacterium]|nr:hypothetical protein [Ignavibacteriales bacterium]